MADEETFNQEPGETLIEKFLKIAPILGVLITVAGLAWLAIWFGEALGLGHMLKDPFFAGVFNYPILFGIQVYFWLFIAWILFIVGAEIFWRFTFWDPITPFHGLFRAFTDGSKAALVGDMNLDWALLSEAGATIIFPPEYYSWAYTQLGWWIKFRAWLYKPDFSASIAAKLEGKRDDPTMITIGKIATYLIIDAEWWTDKQSEQRQAIIKATDKWNHDNPNDQIHRFSTFIKYIKDGRIGTNGPLVKPDEVVLERVVPWARITAAFPIIRSDAAWAGFIRQIAEEMWGASNVDMNRWAVYILIFGACLCAAMFLSSWIFPHQVAPVVAAQVTPIMTPPGL